MLRFVIVVVDLNLQILLVHGERPRGHSIGVEATVDHLLAALSELASVLFVAQQGGKLVG